MSGASPSGFDHSLSAGRRIASNTFFLSIADVVNKVMMFVFYMVAARRLGVEQFGVICFAIAFVTMWSVFSDLGLGIVSARELARDRNYGRQQVNIAMAIKIVASLIVIGAIVIAVNVMGLSSEKIRVVYISTVFVIESAFITYYTSVFQGLEKMSFTTLTRILQGGVLVGGVLLLHAKAAQVEHYAWLYVLAGFTSVVFAGIAAYFLIRPFPDFNFKRWGPALKQAIPIGLAVIFVSFYYWNGTTLLTKLSNDRAVGAYSAAFRLVWGSMFIPLSFSSSIYPLFARLYVSNPLRLQQVLNQALRYITLVALPIGVLGMLMARPLIFLIYGGEYTVAVLPLMILAWWSAAACFSSLLSNYFIAINQSREMTFQAALSLGVNLLGNFLLIRRFGAVGAAVAILGAEVVGVVYLWLRHLRTPFKVSAKEYLLIFLRTFGSLIPGVVIIRFFGRFNIWLATTFAGILYIAVLILTGALNREDLKFIQLLLIKNDNRLAKGRS